MNEGKGFFLGILAAVVLYLLWKKERGSLFFSGNGTGARTSSGNGCGCRSACSAASPTAQGTLASDAGQISPGTPPLQGVFGVGSFYADDGPTSDLTFTNVPGTPVAPTATAAPDSFGNVPGSPTTPANQVPVRAMQPVGSYSDYGFVQRYSIAGIPRTALN